MGDCAAGWKEKVLNENGKASQCRAYNLWLKSASGLYCPCYKEENFENCPFSRISMPNWDCWLLLTDQLPLQIHFHIGQYTFWGTREFPKAPMTEKWVKMSLYCIGLQCIGLDVIPMVMILMSSNVLNLGWTKPAFTAKDLFIPFDISIIIIIPIIIVTFINILEYWTIPCS